LALLSARDFLRRFSSSWICFCLSFVFKSVRQGRFVFVPAFGTCVACKRAQIKST
jgi:hypothetical protein